MTTIFVNQEKLAAAKENYGREIRVFETTTSSQTSNDPTNDGMHFFCKALTKLSNARCFWAIECVLLKVDGLLLFNLAEEPDEFYEFTAEDYYRILATKKEGENTYVVIY